MNPDPGRLPLEAWIQDLRKELDDLRAKNLYRKLPDPDRSGSVDFSSNDYLSLNEDYWTARRITDLINDGGAGSTGSRLISGNSSSLVNAEETFADFVGCESALLFHSGYAANTGLISALVSPGDLILTDRLIHASLVDGIRLSGAKKYFYRHNDLRHLEELLRSKRTSSRHQRIWILTESVFSMDGDRPDLKSLLNLAERHGALCIVDEAHAIGLYGKTGEGLVAGGNLLNRVAAAVYPMGKAPGLMGAFVCGKKELKEILINRARSLIFTTAQPPFLGDLLAGIPDLFRSEEGALRRKQVFQNTLHMRQALEKAGVVVPAGSDSPILPIPMNSEKAALQLAELARERGFLLHPVRPPSVPPGTSRIRLIVRSNHRKEDLDRLVDTVSSFFREIEC